MLQSIINSNPKGQDGNLAQAIDRLVWSFYI